MWVTGDGEGVFDERNGTHTEKEKEKVYLFMISRGVSFNVMLKINAKLGMVYVS